jgi:tight adherence protein B
VTPDFDAAAGVVQRLAVLLGAGIAPASAWRHAAGGPGSGVPAGDSARTRPSPAAALVASGVLERGGVGRELAEQLLAERMTAPPAERAAWAALAAAWWVAVESGAPLGPTLQRFAASLRELAESLREVEVALAGPRATSRIVLALPAVGLLFGVLLGFDAPRILLTTPPGWVCLAVGGALVACGIRWNGALLRRARVTDAAPGLGLELLAIAVSGGSSLDGARRIVDAALAEAGLPDVGSEADDVLAFARAAGVPAAALLLAEAEELRRRARSDDRRRAAELGTQLLLPLGVCILPAFVALGVAPIVIAILSSTVEQL